MVNNKSSDYWEIDELKNSIDYLEMAVKSLIEAEHNPCAWKWVVIAVHGALYGFGVCAVQGTNPDRVTHKVKNGHRKLHKFDEILEKCQDERWMKQYTFSKTLKISNEQDKAIKYIKDVLRNNLEHFIPKTWAVSIDDIPKAIASCFEVIEFLAIESGNLLRHYTDNSMEHVKALCESGKSLALSFKKNKNQANDISDI